MNYVSYNVHKCLKRKFIQIKSVIVNAKKKLKLSTSILENLFTGHQNNHINSDAIFICVQ